MHIVLLGRRFAKLCFVLILFCLFALGPGSTAWAGASPVNRDEREGIFASTRNAGSADLHVSGRFLLGANGVNFIMRGINHPHTWFAEQTSSFQHIKAKGANTVRVVLSSGKLWPQEKNSASDVANVIQLCKTNRLICVLEVHDTTGYRDHTLLPNEPQPASLAEAVNYWKEIKSALIGQEAYVIINIGNEPYGNPDPNHPDDTLAWVNDTKNAILAMRNAGFQHMLMVDAPNWGQDWQFVMRNNAASIFNTDPRRNTVFSIHMYGVFDTAAAIQNYLSHFVNAGLPLVIGEFGHFHSDGDPDEDTILSSAQANGIGYLGWSWSGNCCGGESLDMVTNFDPNQETPWGTRIIHGQNGILQTSAEASVYSGDQNPIVSSIRRRKPNPTSAASVKFTVNFSESVTGVDTSAPFNDFALTTTGGLTGASITGLSGSGVIRTVTVNTGSGSGTIRLDVVDNGSIKDGNKNSLGGPETGNGNYTGGETYTITKPTNVDVSIGGELEAQYFIAQNTSTRQSFTGINNGPVKITNTMTNLMISAERVIYRVNNIPTSFSEMMALPASQLDTIYWLPWYNNKSLNTQLRIANVSATDAIVHVTIGDVEMTGSPYTLTPGASKRLSYPGIDKGPVKIESDVDIVAAERVIYKVNNVDTSFTELMALPNNQLDNIYWLPWYNNKSLDTQLRIANVSATDATVHVTIGGVEMTDSPYTLAPGASKRLSYVGIDKGPVKIMSDVNIVVAERLIYKVNGVSTSFSEMMALPNSQLDNTYWLPWYNSKDLDTQLRFANVSATEATIHVTIGGVEMTGSPFTLAPGASKRLSYVGIDKGPVKIVSDQNIVTAERVIYKVNAIATSFSEMMGLPNSSLDITYWLPWYNNMDLDTQLRFGVQ